MIEQTPHGWWVVSGDTHFSVWVRHSGRLDHDQYILPLVYPLIRSGSLVIDIGANIGTHTISYLSAVGPSGFVIAYEPHPDAFECLRRNCRGAICHKLAVGSKNSKEWLHKDNNNIGASYLSKSFVPKSHDADVVTMTDVVTLDMDIPIDQYQDISLIKIDTEGCEMEVLSGAQNLIHKYRPHILAEINGPGLARRGHSPKELRSFLNENNYRYSFLPPDCHWESTQADLLCTPA